MTETHAKPARFWNRIARNYAKRPVADEQAYQHKLRETAKLLRPDMQVLEFGCGTGTTALHHGPSVARIDAIDFSSEMIAIAQEKADAQGVTNVHFAVSSIEDWPVPEVTYDMVMAHSVLHLVDDLECTLAQVRRMLKPGGLFESSTTCIGDMNRLVALFLPLGGALGVIPKVNTFKADALRRAIDLAGFETLQTWRPSPTAAIFIVAKAPGQTPA